MFRDVELPIFEFLFRLDFLLSANDDDDDYRITE